MKATCENDLTMFIVLLQKSRSYGRRRNPREIGGWLQQARRLRLQVTAEEIPHQGSVR